FLAKLNESALAPGLEFVLPTEAQWEYACRAGTSTCWHSGDQEDSLPNCAWFRRNASGKTHPVGKLRSNGFGLHDMHGNVSEWCADRYSEDYYAKSPIDDPPGHSTSGGRAIR